MKILIVGTYLPRRCGIATFTHDLYKSLLGSSNEIEILAISDLTESSFPEEVKHIIQRDEKSSYIEAAAWSNQQKYDCCIIQHEFGIFGGNAGSFILDFMLDLEVPFFTNLHTILKTPNPEEFNTLQSIVKLSRKVAVMTNRAVEMLVDVYHIDSEKIVIIPHGIPHFSMNRQEAKIRLGLEGKKVMLSFGLIGRNKGYEIAIKATSRVLDKDFIYIILGATHPNVLKEEGDLYKNSLMQLAADLKQSGKVFFIDHFVSDDLLQIYLKACDFYVTPYPNESQMSSGTLTFALGAGATVLSTPYWYAKDLLANDRGILFDFNDVEALSKTINQLLLSPKRMKFFQKNAEEFGKSMSWKNIGKLNLNLIASLIKPKAEVHKTQVKLATQKFLIAGKSKKLISS